MPRTYFLCFAALFSCCGLNGFAQQQAAQRSASPDFPDALSLLGVATQTVSARDSSSSNQPLGVQS